MDMYFEQGLSEDIKGNYRNAVNSYMLSVENEEMNLDAYLNLIGILTEISLDYGVYSDLIEKGIYTQDEMNDLYEYFGILLNKAAIHFDSNEIPLWKYFKESYFGSLQRDRIQEIIRMEQSNLIPYFLLYLHDLAVDNDVIHYYHKVQELKQLLREKKTIKNRYILSLIESAEKQKGGSPP